jgi:hypothetical protein
LAALISRRASTAVIGKALHPIKLGEANEDATSGTITSFVLMNATSGNITSFVKSIAHRILN